MDGILLRAGNRIENSISSYLNATASHKSVPFFQRLCFGKSTFSVFTALIFSTMTANSTIPEPSLQDRQQYKVSIYTWQFSQPLEQMALYWSHLIVENWVLSEPLLN